MIAELQVGGVFLAPIVLYAVVAAVIFGLCRFGLGATGLLQRIWHPALFEVALYVSILSLLVLFL
jgi:hypothetical protein